MAQEELANRNASQADRDRKEAQRQEGIAKRRLDHFDRLSVMVKLDQPVAGGVGPDEDIVAYSSRCTHMGCIVSEYQPEYNALGPCPCHFSTFDLANNGMVTLGQATQNLPQVVLTVEGEDIYATWVLRLVYGYADTLQGGQLVEIN